MSFTFSAVVITLILSSALIGGLCFTFSNFVMEALSRLPSNEGVAAMQSINVVVLNPVFIIVFFGAALLSGIVAFWALTHWLHPSSHCLLAGALCYLLGTVLVTVVANVPLNNQLAEIEPTDKGAAEIWSRFLKRWTLWNHARTATSLAGALFFVLALVQS
jgi:uncharacterized membrane protein